MKRALETLRVQVQNLAGKYSDSQKRRELNQVFEVLAKEIAGGQLQNQRLMALLRAILRAQPGSTKAVNTFLRSPALYKAMHSGGSYNLE